MREFTDSQFDDFNGVVVPKYFWRDRKLFNEYAKAFAVYIDEQIASVAFAAFCDDEILELGIETVEKFRGKGLAAVACTKLIEYALSQHLEPLWSCRQSNLGSYKLAEQLGFEVSCKLPYYQIHQ